MNKAATAMLIPVVAIVVALAGFILKEHCQEHKQQRQLIASPGGTGGAI